MDTDVSAATISVESVRERLADLRARIVSVSPSRPVKVLAVTKAFGLDAVVAAHAVGLDDVGENYADELVAKARDDAAPASARWHFIGRLQSNKVKHLAPYVSVWQSVDRLKVAERIARFSPGAVVYAQMRPAALAHDVDKGGCPPEDFAAFIGSLRQLGLDVDGVMTVGVAGDPGATEEAFVDAVAFADRWGLRERSLGMSADLEAAIGAGSTMVRVGSALFGARPTTGRR